MTRFKFLRGLYIARQYLPLLLLESKVICMQCNYGVTHAITSYLDMMVTTLDR